MSDKKNVDSVTGIETTGHEWDGIRELNNPLPRWWLWVFYATIVFAIGYMLIFPSVPLGNDYFKGFGGVSQRAKVAEQLASVSPQKAEFLDRIGQASLEEIRQSDELLNFAMVGGGAAYADNCAACHGTGATGGPGYPNLADDDWLWGGELSEIRQTIEHGIRWSNDEDTRDSLMPNFGADGLLPQDQIKQVVEYVRSLSGLEHDAEMAAAGSEIYNIQCVACHAENGQGDQTFGAPALNDQVWLYGAERREIARQLTEARHGVMPAWNDRLDDTTIKMLSVYVHALGGGQ